MQTQLSLYCKNDTPKELIELFQRERCPVCEHTWDRGDVLFIVTKSLHGSSKKRCREVAARFGWNENNKLRFTSLHCLYVLGCSVNHPYYYRCPHCSGLWSAATGGRLSHDVEVTAYAIFINEML